MDPFFFAASTKLVSCSLVAAAPVGLFGEQKKMMSDFSAYKTHTDCSAVDTIDNQTASSEMHTSDTLDCDTLLSFARCAV